MKTLLIDTSTWDLCLDALGNIAVADEPYALAQDVATEIQLWLGEYWYDTTRGVPWFNIFGQTPIPWTFLKSVLTQAALGVPDVGNAQVFIGALNPATRKVTGQVQLTRGTQTLAVNFEV